MTQEVDINQFVPVSRIVKAAIADTYGDYDRDQARYSMWVVRGVKKLTRQVLKGSGRRFGVFNINMNLHSAFLPCDFEDELVVAVLDDCGTKHYLTPNHKIANTRLASEVPCENECDKGCECYPKQLCADLQTTQVINKIRINDTDYDQTVTSTLLPTGEYYVVTTTPYLNKEGNGIYWEDTKEYQTVFDVAECGCIEKTERNQCKLQELCYDLWCCYCSCGSGGDTDLGGYKIFKENNTIQFDRSMPFKKFYMEWRGSLPKSGNEYLVPEVAFEALVNFSKFKSVENKKGVPMNDRVWHWDRYLIEYDNMTKTLGHISLAAIIDSALRVPSFDYNGRYCVSTSMKNASASQAAAASSSSSSSQIIVPTPSLPSTGCNPSIITTNGQEMESGTTYHNALLIGVPFRVYANPFNRMMRSDEYEVLASGGFRVLTGVYGLTDEFDIYPKWCDANTDQMPDQVILGAKKLVVKVDGNPNMPVNGLFTYQNNVLIGATVEDIIVNKTIETVIDGDFTFDSTTGTITRTNQWFTDDTAVINYIK